MVSTNLGVGNQSNEWLEFRLVIDLTPMDAQLLEQGRCKQYGRLNLAFKNSDRLNREKSPLCGSARTRSIRLPQATLTKWVDLQLAKLTAKPAAI